MITQRDLIIDLYIFDTHGNIAAVDRKSDDPILGNTLSMIILTLPLGHHPIEYIKNYIQSKDLELEEFSLLPGIFLNTFDSEVENEYLVTSYKAIVKERKTTVGDNHNRNIVWMPFQDFSNHPSLMPEFKANKFQDMFEGKSMFYKGSYKDSDLSNKILSWEKV